VSLQENPVKKITTVLALFGITLAAAAQRSAPAAPLNQTARQALLEMFFSKTPGTLVRHLPEATKAALDKSGALANMPAFSILTAQVQAQSNNFQTFETGNILISAEDFKTHQKFEVLVDGDSMKGDEDNIDLSFRQYKDGELQHTANFMPRVTFSMKPEAGVWTLNSVSFTVRLPLADPDFLKSITEKMKPQLTASGETHPMVTTTGQNASPAFSDAAVLAAMRTILAAETTYAKNYRSVGYTCTLSDLDGFGSGEANEHQAMLINSGLAGGRKYGYVFALSGCMGAPATAFHLAAVPGANVFGRPAYCADESGAIRSSADGKAESCLATGTPVP
jgi:hypothetical protein